MVTDAKKVTRVVHAIGDQVFQAARPQVAYRKSTLTQDAVKDPEQLFRALRDMDQSSDDASNGARSLPCLGGSYHRDVAFVGGSTSFASTGPSVAPAIDNAQTLLAYIFDETSGTTIHNHGNLGDTAGHQLTMGPATRYTQNAATPLRNGLGLNARRITAGSTGGGFARGAAGDEPTGDVSLCVVCIPFLGQASGGCQLFGKAYEAPDSWTVPPFTSAAITVEDTGAVSGGFTRGGVRSSSTVQASVIVGQPNLVACTWDSAHGVVTTILNGTSAQTTGVSTGDIDYGAHGKWFAGANVIGTDCFDGYLLLAMVENTLRAPAYYAAAYDRLIATPTVTQTITPGTPVILDHGLDGDVAWIPARVRPSAARIYETSQGNGKLTLVADVPCTADIWVWPEPSAR